MEKISDEKYLITTDVSAAIKPLVCVYSMKTQTCGGQASIGKAGKTTGMTYLDIGSGGVTYIVEGDGVYVYDFESKKEVKLDGISLDYPVNSLTVSANNYLIVQGDDTLVHQYNYYKVTESFEAEQLVW